MIFELNNLFVNLSFAKFVEIVLVMPPKRLYYLIVGLFPIVYLIHNAEEWVVLNGKITTILKLVPTNFKNIVCNNPQTIFSIFGIALVVATITPFLVAVMIWNKVSILNTKILLLIAFVTLINAISHIFFSFALGFFSPGFITGVLICIPYSIAIIHFIRKYNKFTLGSYLILGLGSIAVYVLGLGLLWLIGLSFIL